MSHKARAFTLIELLVVISIIALLVGILLPALNAARRSARMMKEMAAARSLCQAYVGYSTDQKGNLLIGYANDNTLAGHPPVDSGFGTTVTGEALHRYPWRLADYLRNNVRGSVLINEQLEALDGGPSAYTGPAPSWEYAVSLAPSFGINAHYLGGRANVTYQHTAGTKPRFHPDVLRNIAHSHAASSQIVFASAGQIMPGSLPDVYGYFELSAPTGAPNNFGTVVPWSSPYNTGYIHFRWSEKAVFAYLDGHANQLDMEQASDMRLWSNVAQKNDNPNQPPSNVSGL